MRKWFVMTFYENTAGEILWSPLHRGLATIRPGGAAGDHSGAGLQPTPYYERSLPSHRATAGSLDTQGVGAPAFVLPSQTFYRPRHRIEARRRRRGGRGSEMALLVFRGVFEAGVNRGTGCKSAPKNFLRFEFHILIPNPRNSAVRFLQAKDARSHQSSG